MGIKIHWFGTGTILCLLIVTVHLSTAQKAYQKKALQLHNRYRATHGSPALTLDNDLNKIAIRCAEYYAKRRAIDSSCPFKKNGMGENRFWGRRTGGYTSDQVAQQAAKLWYGGAKSYHYGNPGFSSSTGSFTQLVWNESETLGFGYAKNKDFAVGVAIYAPAGNVHGRFEENVGNPRLI